MTRAPQFVEGLLRHMPTQRLLTLGGWRILLSSVISEITPSFLEQYVADVDMRTLIIDPAFKMPEDVDGLQQCLEEISQRSDLSLPIQRRLTKALLANFCSALGSARSCSQVNIVVLGGTSQGKSRTINKLIGRPLFEIGFHRSTTKDVVRASVPAYRSGFEVTFSLYDTPGLMDNSMVDRDKNAVTLRRFFQPTFAPSKNHDIKEKLLNLFNENYSQAASALSALRSKLRSELFPNAILLTSTWKDVKEDAMNGPKNFTSALGHSILSIKANGIFDPEHPNVIVVVTRALADTKEDLEGDYPSPEFDRAWRAHAKQKRKIIVDIQKAVFPRSEAWPIVFVENGKPNDYSKYDWLPNNQQSHQNLFEELRHIFNHGAANGVKDLLGLHALGSVLSGTNPQIIGQVKHEVVTHIPEGDYIPENEVKLACEGKPEESADPQLVKENRVKRKASKYLGHSYNPVRNLVSTGLVVDRGSELQVDTSWDDGFDDIKLISTTDAPRALRINKMQLGIDEEVEIPGEANAGETAPNNEQPGDRHDPQSQPKDTLEASKIVARVGLDTLSTTLSSRMLKSIEALPRWNSEDEMSRIAYHSFFELHGTHIMISVALGGQVHIQMRPGLNEALLTEVLQNGCPMQSLSNPDLEHKRPDLEGATPSVDLSRISCRGGYAAHQSLVKALEVMVYQTRDGGLPPYEDWHTMRAGWSEELFTDPKTLTYLPQTSLMWLHAASGLTPEQQTDLAKAADWYIRGGKVKLQGTNYIMDPASTEPPTRPTNLPRVDNDDGADRDREKGQEGFFAWIGSKCVIQ